MKNKIPDRNAAPQYQPSKHTRPDPGTLASLAKPHVSVLYFATATKFIISPFVHIQVLRLQTKTGGKSLGFSFIQSTVQLKI